MRSHPNRSEPLGYRASGNYPLRWEKSPRRDTIIPAGVIFDNVKWTGETIYRKSFYPGHGMPPKGHPIIRNHLCISASMDSYPNGETVENAYALVVAAGHLQQKPAEDISNPELDMLLYCAWLHAKMMGDDEGTSRLENMNINNNLEWNAAHVELVRTVCLYRRFFITEKGYLGLGPGRTEVGDQVCVLFGGKMPFILRRVLNHFKLIGESYVYGIMDGEGLQQWEAREASEQWFEIR